jgi:hypothetical protein
MCVCMVGSLAMNQIKRVVKILLSEDFTERDITFHGFEARIFTVGDLTAFQTS